MSFSNLTAYQSAREDLIASDRSFRRDSKTKSLRSAIEIKADAVVRRIRKAEAASIWTQENPEVPHPFPGMEFLTGILSHSRLITDQVPDRVSGKHIIEKTKLFEILCQVSAPLPCSAK